MLYLEMIIYEEMVNFLNASSEQERQTQPSTNMQHKEAHMHSWKKNALLKHTIMSASCSGINSMVAVQKGIELFWKLCFFH